MNCAIKHIGYGDLIMFYEVVASFKVEAESREEAEKIVNVWLDELRILGDNSVYVASEMTTELVDPNNFGVIK